MPKSSGGVDLNRSSCFDGPCRTVHRAAQKNKHVPWRPRGRTVAAAGMDDLSRIIENTYSAATDPAAWPVVVDSLQAYFRCSSVGLYNADLRRGTVSLVHVRDIDPAYVRVYV